MYIYISDSHLDLNSRDYLDIDCDFSDVLKAFIQDLIINHKSQKTSDELRILYHNIATYIDYNMQEELINAIEFLTSFTIDKYTIKLFDNIDNFDKKKMMQFDDWKAHYDGLIEHLIELSWNAIKLESPSSA